MCQVRVVYSNADKVLKAVKEREQTKTEIPDKLTRLLEVRLRLAIPNVRSHTYIPTRTSAHTHARAP